MKIQTILFYVMFGIALFICLKIYQDNKDTFSLKCIISSKDGNRYCVRDREQVNKAVDLLAEVSIRCKTLVQKMKEKYPDDERIKRMCSNFNPKKIMETLPTSELTAYSENKGEKIAFCLNKTRNDDENLIDADTLTFVALHELSHTMTKSIGHKQEFWENFKFILINAKEFGIYQPKNYKKENREYCGMIIKDNPYYDL